MGRSVHWAFAPFLFATVACSVGCAGNPSPDVPAADATHDTAADATSDTVTDTMPDTVSDAPHVDATDATDAPQPACSLDTDCDDHLYCNGVEHCAAGH